jgi:hypothetical protein
MVRHREPARSTDPWEIAAAAIHELRHVHSDPEAREAVAEALRRLAWGPNDCRNGRPSGVLRLSVMATLATYSAMMQRDRKREGLRVCRAAWLVGVSVREYREIEAGDRMPSLDTYRRISELYGWPQTFVAR